MKSKRWRELVRLMVVLGLALVSVSGLTGCGDEDGEEDNGSPIHAVASVLLVEGQSADLNVEVRLIVVRETGVGSFTFVEDAENVVLDVDGVEGEGFEMARQKVELAQPEGGGEAVETFFYRVFSTSTSALTYEPGKRYTVAFSIPAGNGEVDERYSLTVTSPPQSGEINKASEESVAAKLEIVSSPPFSDGLIEVRRPDANVSTYVSFPYKDRFMTSANDLMDAVEQNALGEGGGELLTVPKEAFTSAGTHSVTYTGLSVERAGSSRVSANLGRFSTIFSGQAVSLEANPR